jgi:hypothetical protein
MTNAVTESSYLGPILTLHNEFCLRPGENCKAAFRDSIVGRLNINMGIICNAEGQHARSELMLAFPEDAARSAPASSLIRRSEH